MQLRAIPELLDYRFLIPEYQRGFRWEKRQVEELLKDLNNYSVNPQSSQFYCLQPIVVKRCSKDILNAHQLDGDYYDIEEVVDVDNQGKPIPIIDINKEKQLWFEVIDGQQRLTTLRILMQVLDQWVNLISGKSNCIHNYTIHYATRPSMTNIFSNIVIDTSVSPWKIDRTKDLWNNIDSQYIFNAAEIMLDWFQTNLPKAIDLHSFIYGTKTDSKSVQVVWYETTDPKDARDIFHEINALKVGLSCSELIRSQFLAKSACFNINLNNIPQAAHSMVIEERSNRLRISINEKWDEIEHTLSDLHLRSFLTRRKVSERNSIELLFDLMSGKYVSNAASNFNKSDDLYTALHFNDMFENTGPGKDDTWDIWKKVLHAYDNILFWYQDRTTYHWIGYLNAIASLGHEDDLIHDLLQAKLGKNAIEKKLKDEITKIISTLPRGVNNYSNLSYETHRDYINKVLLLHNVETIRRQSRGAFFPFEQYLYMQLTDSEVANLSSTDKRGAKSIYFEQIDLFTSKSIWFKLQEWTLEHIHAQNSQGLPKDKKDVWAVWLKHNLDALQSLSFPDRQIENDRKNLIISLVKGQNDLQANRNTYNYPSIQALFDSVMDFYDKLEKKSGNPVTLHQLSNLTLLTRSENSCLGPDPFEVKRQMILKDIEKNDTYYPICTEKVFLKMYSSDPDSTQIHSWSKSDRQYYYDDIKEKIGQFVKQGLNIF